MTSDLRPCCQKALIDCLAPEEHYPDCDARAEDPQTDPLFPPPVRQEGGPQ